MPSYPQFARFSCAILFSLSALTSHAQNDDVRLDERYKNWYQIEVIVFERIHQDGANQVEIWPNNIDLHYPPRLDFLFTEEEWQAFIAPPEEINEARLNADGSLSFEETEANANKTTSTTSAIENAATTSVSTSANTSQSGNINAQNRDTQNSEDLLPDMELERIKLNAELRQLNREALKMARRSNFNVLFHEAWRQEVQNTKESSSIAIRGGSNIESHYELEGSIKVSVNRYLHVETNLWRTLFDPNYGQETQYWPTLPPLAQPVKATTEIHLDTHSITPELSQKTQGELTRFQNLSLADDFNLSNQNGNLNLDLSSNDQYALQSQSNFDITTPVIEESEYVVSEIITLRQKRRMRSSELHYIDHPRLGVLVKITPYEVPMEKEEANALSLRTSE